MSSWVRRQFGGIGLTQSPPGQHLAALQTKHGGTVLLCIDVSGSMSGEPLSQAIKGGAKFLTEAEKAHYRCGLVLWSDIVDEYVPPGKPMKEVRAALENASIRGGTELSPALRLGIEELGSHTGDRVLCVFSDGGIGDKLKAKAIARELCAMGVRIIVRGLGHDVAGTLASIACPGDNDDHRVVDDVSQISSGIASMATGLTTRQQRG
jgi:Mg-chelatase subunit ChlD